MDEKEIKVNGARIVYFKGGSGADLVLLPSAGGRGKEYKEIFPYLTPYFSVYTLDYPGFGRSEEIEKIEGVDHMAEFVIAWLDVLGIQGFFLAGFSMGGAIALHMALRFPERIRRLCVIGTAAGTINDIPIISPVGLNMKEILTYFYHRPEVKERIKNETLNTEEKREIHRSSKTFERMVKTSKVFTNILDQLSLIACPTLVIGAENDRVVPVPYQKAIFNQIPGAKWKVYPETGHFIIVERPEGLADDLNQFFNQASD